MTGAATPPPIGLSLSKPLAGTPFDELRAIGDTGSVRTESEGKEGDLLRLGREVLSQQGFSRLLGAELESWDSQVAVLRLTLRPDLLQQHGFAHGGVLSYLADNAITYAGAVALEPPVLTSEFKINYVRPAVGEALVARASAVAAGRQQAVCRCDVFVIKDGVEKLCAVAQGTIVRAAGA